MTVKPNAGPKSAGQFTWLWMILAVVAIGGFFTWLAANSKPSSVVVVDEEEPALATSVENAVTVTLADLMDGIDQYRGQVVRVEGVQVVSMLGDRAFWTTFPNNTPFLIKIGDSLAEEGFSVQAGDVVTVVGQLSAMSESVLTAWEEQGVLQNANQRLEAEFATDFIDVVEAVRADAAE